MNNRRIFSLALCGALCVVVLAALLFLVGEPARAQGATRYVATSGTDSGGCTDPNNPCRTVQYAVDAAEDEDLIKVATGVYTGVHARLSPTGYGMPPTSRIITQVVYISKTATIRGGYTTPGFTDPPDPEANPTTLDAQGQGRVLFIGGSITPTIEGLRITGGDAAGLRGGDMSTDAGGGIYILDAMAKLRNNHVFSNTATNGGGLALWESGAMISENTFIDNTAARETTGLGGGLYLIMADATLSGNTIISNTANAGGGGVFSGSGVVAISDNRVFSNTTFGNGGGLYLSSNEDTVSGNTISGNTASNGGGLRLEYSSATLSSNTVSDNTASNGGGLDLYGGDDTLNGNTISDNTASFEAGGLYLWESDATLKGNSISGNASTGEYGNGGGLVLAASSATLSENTITANSVAYRGGGGLYLLLDSDATLTNNVIAGNQANTAGSGLFISGSSPRLLHTTIGRNTGGDGSGVHITGDHMGNPCTVGLTNTILVSHNLGIIVDADCTATLEGTLWHGNSTDWGGSGTINHTNDYTGDPVFVDPAAGDYHIGPGSAAIDRGVDADVRWDIDHEPRFEVPDLGADEYWPPGVLKHVYLPLVLCNGP